MFNDRNVIQKCINCGEQGLKKSGNFVDLEEHPYYPFGFIIVDNTVDTWCNNCLYHCEECGINEWLTCYTCAETSVCGCHLVQCCTQYDINMQQHVEHSIEQMKEVYIADADSKCLTFRDISLRRRLHKRKDRNKPEEIRIRELKQIINAHDREVNAKMEEQLRKKYGDLYGHDPCTAKWRIIHNAWNLAKSRRPINEEIYVLRVELAILKNNSKAHDSYSGPFICRSCQRDDIVWPMDAGNMGAMLPNYQTFCIDCVKRCHKCDFVSNVPLRCNVYSKIVCANCFHSDTDSDSDSDSDTDSSSG